jgi:hypothetical protein
LNKNSCLINYINAIIKHQILPLSWRKRPKLKHGLNNFQCSYLYPKWYNGGPSAGTAAYKTKSTKCMALNPTSEANSRSVAEETPHLY